MTALRCIVGCDPGLATFGFVAVQTDGRRENFCSRADVFTSRPWYKENLADGRVRRSRELHRWFTAEIDRAKPELVAAEEMSFPPHADNTRTMVSLAWGVVVSILEVRQIPLIATGPREWRAALVPGGGEKNSWREAVYRIPTFSDRSAHIKAAEMEHALDALGVACWAVGTRDVLELVRRS